MCIKREITHNSDSRSCIVTEILGMEPIVNFLLMFGLCFLPMNCQYASSKYFNMLNMYVNWLLCIQLLDKKNDIVDFLVLKRLQRFLDLSIRNIFFKYSRKLNFVTVFCRNSFLKNEKFWCTWIHIFFLNFRSTIHSYSLFSQSRYLHTVRPTNKYQEVFRINPMCNSLPKSTSLWKLHIVPYHE